MLLRRLRLSGPISPDEDEDAVRTVELSAVRRAGADRGAGDVVAGAAAAPRRRSTARGVTRRYGSRVALEPTDLDVRARRDRRPARPERRRQVDAARAARRRAAADGRRGRDRRCRRRRSAGRRSDRRSTGASRRARTWRCSPGCSGCDDPGAAAEAMLAEFELPPDGRPSAHLSVGNQQRLNLAIAFLGRAAGCCCSTSRPPRSTRRRRAALWERIAPCAGRRSGRGRRDALPRRDASRPTGCSRCGRPRRLRGHACRVPGGRAPH